MVSAVKLIDRIRLAEATLQDRLDEEKRQIAEAQKKLDDEDRAEGRQKAYQDIPLIDSKILCAVDEGKKVYEHPVGRGRQKPMTPFEEAYADYLLAYFRSEGVAVTLEKLPLYQGKPVPQAHDYNLRFAWDHV